MALHAPPGQERLDWRDTVAWLNRLFRRWGTDRLMGEVSLDGHPYPLSGLSPTGLRLTDYDGPLAEQDRVRVTVSAHQGDKDLQLDVEAIIAWRDAGGLGATFYALETEARQRLEDFLATRA